MSNNYSSGMFPSSDGKSQTAYFIWTPQGKPVGVVQISHGMNEYIGRYGEFAEFLCSHGYVVCGNDHIGHGHTAPTDDDLGYIPRRGGVDILIDDLRSLGKLIKQKHPELPVFLLGHSMGSFVARIYAEKYAGDDISGAVIMGTTGPGQPAGIGKFIARIMGLTNKGRKRSKFIDNIVFGKYLDRIGKGSPKFAWLSRDRDIVEKYSTDKYCSSYIFTADGFYVLFDMLKMVSAKGWAQSLPGELPTLVISGGEDPVGGYGAGAKMVYERLLAAGVQDLSFRLYPEMRHEILNELGRERVYNDLLEWFNKRAEPRAAQNEG